MSKQYVQVNIGRGNLDSTLWGEFIAETTRALSDSIRDHRHGQPAFIEQHNGEGTWMGVKEESCHLSTFADVDLYALRVKLRKIKTTYDQDAIALIVGSDLID